MSFSLRSSRRSLRLRKLRSLLGTVFLAGCFPQGGDRALPVAVVDTSTLEIVERWRAPHLTYDVAFDDATGRLWAASEAETPRVWELSAEGDPVFRHKLSNDFDPIWKGDSLDFGAVAVDSTARRGAFTSPRSKELALLDLDSGEFLGSLISDYLPHGVVFDTQRGLGYSDATDPYVFRSSDGELLGYSLCAPQAGGPSLSLSSAGFLFAPSAPLFADDELCIYHPDTGPVFTDDGWGCDSYCAPAGTAVTPSGSRLFVATPMIGSPDGPGFHVLEVAVGVEYFVTDVAGPHGFELSPDGSRLYVTEIACNRISVYDPRPFAPEHLFDIEMDGETMGMDLSADGSRLYVAQVDPAGALGHGKRYLDGTDGDRHTECPPILPPP